MRTAKAAVYEAPNTPFVLKEFPVRPANRGEVLVRVTMSTICRSDIHSYEGRRPNPCPGILGHEIIGVIEELGESIDKDMRGDPLKVGDRITWSEYFFDGQCYYREVLDMPQKCHGVRKYGHDLAAEDPHFLGGFAEYCYILPGTWILKLPDELSDEEATPLNCGVATMASVTEAAEIALGDAVVVQGLGLLGLYGVAMAKARGARCVIGLDAVASRLDAAKKFGADHVIDIARVPAQAVVDRSQGAVPARRRRRGDRGLRRAGCHSAGFADAAHRRPLCARRFGQPGRQCDHRRQYPAAALDHHARHSQLSSPASHPGARFCDGKPQAFSIQGHRRCQICLEGSRRRFQESLGATVLRAAVVPGL